MFIAKNGLTKKKLWLTDAINNWLFKRFRELYIVYACNRYLVIFTYIFRFVLNFTNVITIIAPR